MRSITSSSSMSETMRISREHFIHRSGSARLNIKFYSGLCRMKRLWLGIFLLHDSRFIDWISLRMS